MVCSFRNLEKHILCFSVDPHLGDMEYLGYDTEKSKRGDSRSGLKASNGKQKAPLSSLET